MGLQIALLAGEASGDRVAGQLARALKELRPDVTLWGTGGKYLRDAGVEVVVDASQWGIVGIAAALRLLPEILPARRRLLATIKERKPDLIIPIDAGALHLGFGPLEGICPFVRRELPATKILYYFPPGSWRKTLRGSPLGPLTDKVATPFPWSERELRRLGVDAEFVGHPLLDLVAPNSDSSAFLAKHGLDPDRPIVALAPGSRRQEIDAILPAQLDAAARIASRVPGVQFLLILAPTVSRELVDQTIARAGNDWERRQTAAPKAKIAENTLRTNRGTVPMTVEGSTEELLARQARWTKRTLNRDAGPTPFPSIRLVESTTYDPMRAADVLICKSGTTTLEAAILKKPMVIVYKMAAINRIQYQFIKKKLPPFIGMPNLIAERKICPELIQDDATGEAIAREVIDLLLEPERLLRMRADLERVVGELGEPGGATRTARLALALLERPPVPDGRL